MNDADDLDDVPNRRWPNRRWPNRRWPNRRWSNGRWPNRSPESVIFGAGSRWSVSLGGSREVSVSTTVPVVMLGGVILGFLPESQEWVWMAGGFWVAGWAAQIAASVVTFRCIDRFPDEWTLTLAGVWWAPSPDSDVEASSSRSLRATDFLIAWSIVLLLLAAGSGWWLTLEAFRLAGLDRVPSESVDGSWWPMPSMGSSGVDRPWAAAAWLWCVQACWQASPLPHSLGRIGWSCCVALWGGGPNRDPQAVTVVMRRSLLVISGLMLFLILWAWRTSSADRSLAVGTWGGVVLVAVWLGLSASGSDLAAIQRLLARTNVTGRWRSGFSIQGWRDERRRKRSAARQHQRLLRVMAQERDEASDAAKAEEILRRLHDEGPDSLSENDRQLLRRVSDAIRRNRE